MMGGEEEGNYTMLLEVITDKDDTNLTKGLFMLTACLNHTFNYQIPRIDHTSLIGCYHFDVFQFTS